MSAGSIAWAGLGGLPRPLRRMLPLTTLDTLVDGSVLSESPDHSFSYSTHRVRLRSRRAPIRALSHPVYARMGYGPTIPGSRSQGLRLDDPFGAAQ